MDWFLCTDEKVEGPYTQEAIKGLIEGQQLDEGCLVWGRGRDEWISAKNWLQSLNQSIDVDSVRPFAQTWHYAINGDSKGPFSRAELIHELRNVREKDQVLVWTKGMKAWADLFEFHDLLDELNLERREDPRVDIKGQIVAKNESGRTSEGQLHTISVGGCGAYGLGNLLQIGNEITIEIKSPVLANTIVTSAQVQYVTESGFVGIRFNGLNSESKSMIQQYIRENTSAGSAEAA